MHGTTYGGNPVACVAGSVVMDEVMSGMMDHVREVGEYLHGRLRELQSALPELVREIRGRGCMQGVVLSQDAAPFIPKLLERGVIANATAGTVIRLVPPFIITRSDIDELHAALTAVLTGA
jgi:acetylornithine/succinyldiaminopimelate/putrescine aminotransferase